MKKLLMIVTLTITMTCSIMVANADSIFTKQPKSGTVDINKDYTLTWETNRNDCTFMLQQRDGNNYEWGNVAEVTSPHKINYPMDIELQYRIMALCGNNQEEYYSDIFTGKWVMPDNTTTAEIADIKLGDLPLGYSNSKTYAVSIKNTGNYNIVSPKIVLGGGEAYYDIIQNKTPHDIKPGETDNTTFSIKLKSGLGVGYYDTGIYLQAENTQNGTGGTLEFTVVESNVELTYDAEANSIDFGTLEYGYNIPEDQVLTVRATGTGNLTHVRIVKDESDITFFDMQINNPVIDKLGAGLTSGNNWVVRLRNGLEPGEYESKINIYADELEEPVVVSIKATIVGETEEIPTVGDTTVETDTPNVVEEKIKKDSNLGIIIGVAIAAVVVGASVTVLIMKKKNK